MVYRALPILIPHCRYKAYMGIFRESNWSFLENSCAVPNIVHTHIYHIISYIISYHISYHIISYHIIYHISYISYHIISYYIISTDWRLRYMAIRSWSNSLCSQSEASIYMQYHFYNVFGKYSLELLLTQRQSHQKHHILYNVSVQGINKIDSGKATMKSSMNATG